MVKKQSKKPRPVYRKPKQVSQASAQDFRLPLDVLGVVAQHLIASDLFGTCAALNTTCKAVKEETNRTLWRSFLVWGCGVYGQLASVKGPLSGPIKSKQEERAQKEWERYEKIEASKWIEYLYKPFDGFETSWYPMDPKTDATRWRKATIEVDDMPHMLGEGSCHPSLLAFLYQGHEYGTQDILALLDTVAAVGRLGSRKIKEAITGPNGICIVPKSSESPEEPFNPQDGAIKEDLARLKSTERRRLDVRPDNITLRTVEEVSIRSLVLCLLDVLFAVRVGEWPSDRRVEVRVVDTRMEAIEESAKILVKATQAQPQLATTSFLLMLNFQQVPADYAVRTMPIVEALRNIYLATPRSLYTGSPPTCALKMTFGSRRSVTWYVKPDPRGRRVETWMEAQDGRKQCSYFDKWEA